MRGLALALCVMASHAVAAPPETAPRPAPRADLRIDPPVVARAGVLPVGATLARSLRPVARPKAFAARSAVSRALRSALGAGEGQTLCGDPAIRGAAIAPVAGRIKGCGIANPVRVEWVSGVRLSRPTRMDCPTAKALRTWIERGVAPAVGGAGGGLAKVKVVAGYACRTRNSRPGAKLSEHGKGRAIDVAGIELVDGTRIGVEDGWRHRSHGRILKAMHRAACGPFGTVLGPDADVYHRDHLHLDTARYRSGAYCK